MTWRHPTGGAPKRVGLACLGPSKLNLIEVQTAHQPQSGLRHDDVDEVWGLNAGINWLWGRASWDVLFVMDHLSGEEARLPSYAEHIRDRSARTPVISSDGIESFPDVYPYPIVEVVEMVGREAAYFHNSVPYILAYALLIGVEEIHIWGADYSHERLKDREADRANAEYWIGYCRAKGMRVIVPEVTTLLNAGNYGWFYGYQHQPPKALRDA